LDPNAAPRNYEYKFLDKKGSIKDISATVAMIPGTKKSIGSFLDITELKSAEKALRESEQGFRDLLENSLTGIFLIQDKEILYVNPEQKRLSGSPPDSLEPIDFEFIHPEDVEKVKRGYQSILLGAVRTLDVEFRFYPPGKMGRRSDMKWVYCRANLVQYQGKEAVLVNMLEVTKAKELENLLKIRDKMTSLGHVAAGIAHEIRNPLSGINIYLTTLEKIYDRGGDPEKIKEIIKEIQSASRRIESIIKRVMDFSKPGAPRFMLTDINQPIEEAMGLSSVTLRKTGIKIEKTLASGLPLCRIDPQLIEEVILNLVTNAAEAMKNMNKAKKIVLTSSIQDNQIVIEISDSGPGVPQNMRDQIFDPFYTTKSESTGIGLSLSHRIITDHGGSLSVSTGKWGGAGFTIKIPLEKDTE
jgi:PAS domain S-box-containing protein